MIRKVAKRLAKRFIAGESFKETLPYILKLNQKGIAVSLDILGESVHSKEECESALEAYLELLDHIAEERLQSNISVKVTQMGLDIDPNYCLSNMRQILTKAQSKQSFVRLDMEGSAYTSATIDIFKTLHQEFTGHVGIVIQAYLHRSEEDVKALSELKAPVRICKGAYKESPQDAIQEMSQIRQNFKNLVGQLLSKNCPVAFATHDQKLIDWASQLIEQNDSFKDLLEFQVLYGLKRKTISDLAAQGYKARVYIPFGKHWIPYFTRRLTERKENVFFVLKGFFED